MSFQMHPRTLAEIGLALQQARAAAGLSQRDLAADLGISQRYLWELESGKEFQAISRLLDAFNATGVDIILSVPEGADIESIEARGAAARSDARADEES
ncbi:helix-turn-helix domain-containing protein [Agromyces sp. SYSU T00194]|uniref:helix-turn-helix domain-containing protein n=1 Tax=Agromyces chitinivorans TaxID=3158560 RepID=UPI003398763B